jgi:hypothetical protein
LPKHKACDHVIPLTAQAKALIGTRPEGCNGNAMLADLWSSASLDKHRTIRSAMSALAP